MKFKNFTMKTPQIVDFEFKKLVKELYDFLYGTDIKLSGIILNGSNTEIGENSFIFSVLNSEAQYKADEEVIKIVKLQLGSKKEEKLKCLEDLFGKKETGKWKIDKIVEFEKNDVKKWI